MQMMTNSPHATPSAMVNVWLVDELEEGGVCDDDDSLFEEEVSPGWLFAVVPVDAELVFFVLVSATFCTGRAVNPLSVQ